MCHSLSCRVMSCHVIVRPDMLSYVMLCHLILCYVILSDAILCHDMLCRAPKTLHLALYKFTTLYSRSRIKDRRYPADAAVCRRQ